MGKLANVYYEIGYKVNDDGFKKADGGLLKLEKKAMKLAPKIGKAFPLAIAAGITAVGIAVNSATNEFALFDDQLRKVNAKGDMTVKSYNILKDAAFDAGKNTRYSATESAKGLEFMAMAGWSAVNSAKALPAALNMAIVSGEGLAGVTDIMTDQMTVFDLGADKAEHFADVLAYSANKSNTSITMLGEGLKYAGAPMKALGSTIEETTAFFMSMADGGIKSSQAGTTLRSAALSLVDPSKKAASVMKRLRLEVKDSTGNFVGMTNIIQQLETKTKDMTNVQKAQVLTTLFGKEAVSGMMVILNQGTEKLQKNTEALRTNNGYAKDAADYMNNSLQGALLGTTSKHEALSLVIGETFAPAKLELVKSYNGLLDSALTKLTDNKEETQRLSDVTVGFVSVAVEGAELLGKGFGMVGKGLYNFTTNTLDLLSFGQYSKVTQDATNQLEAIGASKRLEQEAAYEKVHGEKPKGIVPSQQVEDGVVPTTTIPSKEEIKTINNNSTTQSTPVTNETNFNGGVHFNFPPGTNVNDTEELKKNFSTMMKEELDKRNKVLENNINPKRR